MKKTFVILLYIILSASVPAEESDTEKPAAPPPPSSTFPAGSVRIGDTIIGVSAGGKIQMLMEDGKSVIYRDPSGISTFSAAPRNGGTPQFVQDSTGKVIGPLKAAEAPEMPRRPDPAAIRPNAPSPIPPPERPGRSNMPSTPFLRPNPLSR